MEATAWLNTTSPRCSNRLPRADVVTVPMLPGLVTEGDPLEEARAMVKDAIRGYLESLIKHGEEIPVEPGPGSVERVAVTIASDA